MKRLFEGDKVTPGLQIGGDRMLRLTSRSGRVLDGNQYTGTVQTVDKKALTNPEFAGVNWLFEPVSNGIWRLLNQGDLECGLSGTTGTPRLGHLSADATQSDATGTWLIYSYGTRGDIMLRPLKGEWLCVNEDGDVSLSRCAEGDETSALWRLS